MKILLDHCVPRPFERLLPGHDVSHTSRLRWGHLSNGRLLTAAEDQGFDALVTVDRNMQHQLNMSGRKICIFCLDSYGNDLSTLLPLAGLLMIELMKAEPGRIFVIRHPDLPK